jgi:predicted amidophosphoribosyltransferase
MDFQLLNLSKECLICQSQLSPPSSPVKNLCQYCFQALEYNNQQCSLCDSPVTGGEICSNCQITRPIFDRNISSMLYFGLGKRLLKRLKTDQEKKYLQLATNLLTHKIQKEQLTFDYLTHAPRFRAREFNKLPPLTLNIGIEISKLIKTPFKPFLIKQIKDKPHQKTLNAKSRQAAVLNCYHCDYQLTGASIGVIDDILTTGATMNALAKTLKDKGAKKITSLTLARTPKMNHLNE